MNPGKTSESRSLQLRAARSFLVICYGLAWCLGTVFRGWKALACWVGVPPQLGMSEGTGASSLTLTKRKEVLKFNSSPCLNPSPQTPCLYFKYENVFLSKPSPPP